MGVEGKSLALLVLSGNQEGRILSLQQGEELLIGRLDGLDLVLPEDLVSRRHAQIEVDEEGAVLRDLGSTNGTFVNGKRIREVRLAEGDRILLGATILSVVPHEEMLLPSGGSLSEVLAAISAGPPRDEQNAVGSEEPSLTGVREEEAGLGLQQEVTGAGSDGPSVTGLRESEVGSDDAGLVQTGAPLGEEVTTGSGQEPLPLPGARPPAPAPELSAGTRLALAEHAPPFRELGPEELDLLQAALQAQVVGRILDYAVGMEDAPALLQGLVEKGYLEKKSERFD